MVQCLLWHLDTDEVVPGQWLKGRIYEHRCDVSPDGKLFVYFAANHKGENWREGSWTAISRPPYLTALALWFKGDCWDGGGIFDGNSRVLINGLHDHEYAKDYQKPGLEVASLGERRGEDWPIEHDRRTRDGWKVVQHLEANRAAVWSSNFREGFATQVPRKLVRTVKDIEVMETYHLRGFDDYRTFEGRIGESTVDLTDARQVDIDSERRRVVYTVKGKLLAFDGVKVMEIADLANHRFEPIPPPDWVQQWPQDPRNTAS